MIELKDYRRPPQDTGVGFHYTAAASDGANANKLAEWLVRMQQMGATWVLVLDCGAEAAQRALSMGFEPIQRVYKDRPGGCVTEGELLHRQQLFIQAGGRWVQDMHNEINNNAENPVGANIIEPWKLAEVWVPWAYQIDSWGGYPSTPALSPGGNWNSTKYLDTFIQEVLKIAPNLFNDIHAWVAIHNYTLNHPVDYKKETVWPPEYESSFLSYQLIGERVVFPLIGKQIPVLSTEGGPTPGIQDDADYPRLTEDGHAEIAVGMVNAMKTAPTYYFGLNFWLIANAVAGFPNPVWESQAWYQPGHELKAVAALKALPKVDRSKVWVEVSPVEPPVEPPVEGGNMEEQLIAELMKWVRSELVKAAPGMALAWLQAGGLESDLGGGFRSFMIGQGQIPVTGEAVNGIVSLANSRIAELAILAKKA